MSTVAIAAQIGPCSPPVPGQGFVRIQGWGSTAETLEFALLENQNRHYLQGDGSWGNAPYWFCSAFVGDDSGEGLRCHVDTEIVGALLRCGSNVAHRLYLRDPANHQRTGQQVLQQIPGLKLPTLGTTPVGESGGHLTKPASENAKPATTAEEALPKEVVEPEPLATHEETVVPLPVKEPAKPALKKTWLQRWWWLLILALLLVVGGIAAWWFLFKAQSDAGGSEAPTASAPAAPSAAVPCSVEAMQSDGEMGFVQNCIAQSPTPEALLQTIAAAKQSQYCGIAQRLYANRSQAGDLLIAEAYAKEYDPKFHQPSQCFSQPESDTAVYWWETILSFDAQHALAQERMKELKP